MIKSMIHLKRIGGYRISTKVFGRLIISVLLLVLLSLVPPAFADDAPVSFSQSEYSVGVGKTLKAEAVKATKSSLSYVWTSSDKSIFKVKKGVIEGVSEGKAVLTLTATALSGEVYTISADVNVYIPVKTLTADIEKVTLAQIPFDIARSGEPLKYYQYRPIISISPDNATDKTLIWSSSNPDIASVDETGLITANNAGRALITASAADGSRKSVAVRVIVPKLFLTAKDIVIDTPEGASFGCRLAALEGENLFGVVQKGSCFKLESDFSEIEGDEMEIYNITPIKRGSGSILFVLNGETIATVTVIVQKTAVDSE